MSEYRSSVTGVKIITHYDCKPIPNRIFDWCATDDNYDGTEGSNCPIGYGATEKEAIAELEEQLAIIESEKTAEPPTQTHAYSCGGGACQGRE